MGLNSLARRGVGRIRRLLGVDARGAQIDDLQRQVHDMNVGLNAMIGALRGELHRDVDRLREEADASRRQLEARIGQSCDDVVRHGERHANEVMDIAADRLMARMARIERSVRLLGDGVAASPPAGEPSVPTASEAQAVELGQVDQPAAYASFEAEFRGPSELIASLQQQYVDDVANLPNDQLPVLDLGCGRGEFVDLLTAAGISAYGVDLNADFVADARDRGIDLRLEQAMPHLRSLPDASLRALSSFHVVEHLPFRAIIDLLDEAFRVLAPGGLLLLETPNPENLAVGANRFWLDPTHLRPLPPKLLGFLVRESGFDPVELRRLHPLPDVIDPALALDDVDRAVISVLNETLAGPVDYAALATRPEDPSVT